MGFIQEIIDESKSYGELDEAIVSQLLRNKDYAKGDFRFIGLTDEKIYFSVPEQNLVKWFKNPETTIREEKQYTIDAKSKLTDSKIIIADTISQKYGACLFDPYHQFFLFCKKGDDVFAEIHPKYLSMNTNSRIMSDVKLDELFNDLCKFYE